MSASETVLIVDSDPEIIRDVVRILVPRGYNVLTAPRGTEAIRLHERSKLPVHLLLTAVMMPGLSGFDVAENLWQWNRRLSVVYMSEHNREILFAENARGAAHFLRKPFTEQTLLDKVRDALSERRMPASVASTVTTSALTA